MFSNLFDTIFFTPNQNLKMSILNSLFRLIYSDIKLVTRTVQNLMCVRTYNTKSHDLKVTVCGGAGHIGQLLCLLLKQSPLIDELTIYDIADTGNIAKELAHIDTRCRVSAYAGSEHLKKALEKSQIVVMLAASRIATLLTYDAMFEPNAFIIRELVEKFAIYCPTALLAIATNPVNSMVPLASEVLRSHGVYNPSSVFGVTTIDVVRANAFVAKVQGLEPECVFVPVIGGHADKTIIPVLSQARPCNDFSNEELEKLTIRVQKAHTDMISAKYKQSATLACAFAIARFTISLAKALRRQGDIIECAYVRSDAHPDVKYLATPILLGPRGMQRNLGLPSLSEYERCLFENAIPLIAADICRAERFAKGIDYT